MTQFQRRSHSEALGIRTSIHLSWGWRRGTIQSIIVRKSKHTLGSTNMSWNPQGWAETMSVLVTADFDVVGIL